MFNSSKNYQSYKHQYPCYDVKYREEIFAGALLFLASFYPHFDISLLLIYTYASYFRLKYFSPFVSVLLLPFSPIHALLSILPYPFLFFDKKMGLSYYFSLAFSLFTQNYLLMFFLSFLDRRGLISGGISLLVLTAFLQGNYLVPLGNTAFMLILAGVISSLIEGRISKTTSIVVTTSAIFVYFHLYFVLPAILIFAPWTSLLFAYFNPFLVVISLAELKRTIKIGEIIPSLLSFIYPPLSLTLIKKTSSYLLLIPLAVEIYSFVLFKYNMLNQIELITLFLIAVRYIPYLKIVELIKKYYHIILSVGLVFIGAYYYFFNIDYLLLILGSAIIITFPYMIDIRGLPIAVLSLLNPVAGLGLSNRKYTAFFLLIPLIGYIYFHFSVYSYIACELGFLFSYINFRSVYERFSYFLLGLIYFSYSIYLLLIGEILSMTYYLVLSILFLIIFNFSKNKDKMKINDMIGYFALSFPFPLFSPLFIYLGKKVDPYISLLLEGILVIFLMKISYLNFIII